MGWKVGRGAAVPLSIGGAGSPSNTLLPRPSLPPYQVESWSIQPFGHHNTLMFWQDYGPVAWGKPLLVTVAKKFSWGAFPHTPVGMLPFHTYVFVLVTYEHTSSLAHPWFNWSLPDDPTSLWLGHSITWDELGLHRNASAGKVSKLTTLCSRMHLSLGGQVPGHAWWQPAGVLVHVLLLCLTRHTNSRVGIFGTEFFVQCVLLFCVDWQQEWELLVLQVLRYDVCAITPHDFVDLLLSRLPISRQHADTVRRHTQTFIALCATGLFRFCSFRFSIVKLPVLWHLLGQRQQLSRRMEWVILSRNLW